MLQCIRCNQWFHLKCLAHKIPGILAGDTFFIFSCSICNQGSEFLCRLEVGWEEVCHLALYNLSLICKSKFFDAYTTIYQYIDTNWNKLIVPISVSVK